jgi:GT2 family glycosyltransferase
MMSERLIHVEIVIPVYNRRETTLQGLRSLSRIDRTGLSVHVIIVDDGSTDGTSEAIRERFPEVEIVHGDGTLHYAAGTNRGLERALEKNPDYILAANDDAIFDAQFLRRMTQCAEENPRSVIGALLLLWDTPHQVFQVDPRWNLWYGGWQLPQELTVWTVPREPWEVEIIVGNCVLYPAQAIRECGLMDEKKFPCGWGDAQYTRRMLLAGWRLLIEPRARVWCEPNTNPPPLKTLSKRELLKVLFVNECHPLNLKRQWVARWEAAPSRLLAAGAFSIYLCRLALKSFGLGGNWPAWPDRKLKGRTAQLTKNQRSSYRELEMQNR